MDFREILNRYADAQPRRARGGMVALAGIDFQLRSYLADFVEALARDEPPTEAGEELANQLEALSDYLREDAGALVVVQAKRTLTPAVLREVAAHFARLDLFLEKETGGKLRPEYEVVARYGEQLPWLELAGYKDAENAALAARFRKLRDENRVRQPRIEEDPWWRLIGAAYSKVDDPFAFAREALDYCLRIGQGSSTSAEVRDKVAEAFAWRRRNDQLPGKLLRAEDVAEQPRTREVVVGQVPSLFHLRDGRFAARPAHLEKAMAELDAVVAKREGLESENLPVFWIDGRSGSGKSVLLLQILREIVEQRGWPVIWLGGEARKLAPLIEKWPKLAPGFPAIVAVDDLFDRQNRQEIDLKRIGETVRDVGSTAWPIILTCGPPEFHEALRRESRGEGIEILPWRLPAMDAREKESVQSWYWKRTGQTPRMATPRPQGWQDEPLMVSLLFEMEHGDLRPFASRFAERLDLAGLRQALILPLALNRLYLWAPAPWLESENRNQLDNLNQDSDFRLFTPDLGTSQEPYLRLTHPHLSDQLYQELHPHPSKQAFARDLGEAFGKALVTKPAVAWRLIQACSEGGERLEIVDGPELARQIAEVWKTRVDERRIPKSARPSLYGNLALWARRETTLSLAFGQDLLGRAVETLEDQPGIRHWGIIWRDLDQAAPGDARLHRAAEGWVATTPRLRQREPDWSILWQRLYASANANHRPRLAEIGWQWLERHQDLPDWNFVWQSLAARDEPTAVSVERVLALGCTWIENLDRHGWAYIWQRLVELEPLLEPQQREKLPELARHWLTGRDDRGEWAYVWRRVFDLPAIREDGEATGQLIAAGREWLAGREDRDEWNNVWRRLLDIPPIREDAKATGQLIDAGREWLAGREDREDWAFVWQRLLDIPAVREDVEVAGQLIDAGREWLAGSEDRKKWSHLWECLLDISAIRKDSETTGQLIDAGREWLAGRGDRDDWSFVWERLLDIPAIRNDFETTGQLIDAGREWLAGREDRSDWSFVWERLFERRATLGPDADYLVGEMATWLVQPGNRDRGEWDKFLERLLDARSSGPTLLKLGADWCLANRELPQTAPLAAKILAQSDLSSFFDPLASWLTEWLESHPRAPQAGAVRAILRESSTNPASPGSSWEKLFLLLVAMEGEARKGLLDLEEKRLSGEPVFGIIQKAVKGGYRVRLGAINAFLPGSLLGARPDASWVGWQGEFLVEKVDFGRFNVVVRRELPPDPAHQKRLARFAALRLGEKLSGTVTNIVEYGVFVELGDRLAGLLHHSKAGLERGGLHLHFELGQEVEVVVLDLNPEKLWVELGPSQ